MENRLESDDSCRLMLRNVNTDRVCCCNTADYSMKQGRLGAIQSIVLLACAHMLGHVRERAHVFVLLTVVFKQRKQ